MKHWTEAATFRGEVPWTFEGINTAMLIKITTQMGELLDLLRCPNVRAGLVAMQQVERLAREYWVRPVKKVKAKRKAKVRS